jgi:hypothetical protein
MSTFDDFLEESNEEFNSKLEEWQERLMINAIETNFEKIKENGISDWHLRNMDESELKNLDNTLNIMLEHYESLEEYEKCKIVFDTMQQIKEVQIV